MENVLNELWKTTDKILTEKYQKLRMDYTEGKITKKTYDEEKAYVDGFYDGWKELSTNILKMSNQ